MINTLFLTIIYCIEYFGVIKNELKSSNYYKKYESLVAGHW